MTTTTAPRRRTSRQTPTAEAQLRGELRQYSDTVELLTLKLEEASRAGQLSEAGVTDLERQIVNDPGWRSFTILAEREFSPEGMVQMRAVCRLMSIANPLIKRGLNMRAYYVWGQGCEIVARANGKTSDGEQDVQSVIAEHVDDEGNQRSFWGQQAREENEQALGTDGEVFVQLFTKPASGWVQVRTVPADEISDVFHNPEDRSEPWFYRRDWSITNYGPNGQKIPAQRSMLYPDIDYKPKQRPAMFAGIRIAWDAPMMHVHVNRPKGWLRGIPDAYSVVNWARAYKEFLEQWAGLMRSLAKFAWRLTAEGRNRAQAKAAVAAAGTSRGPTGETNSVGGTAITPMGATMEAIPKSGATIDAESGRPIATLVASGLNLPVTILLADPGQTGARATAETLDWPTELAMTARRGIWTAAQRRILRYVITESVRASAGKLKGTIKPDAVTGREVVTLAGETDDTIDIVWPELDEVDPEALIRAAVAASSTGTIPPELLLRLLLKALGERNIESIMESMVDDQGNFLWPETPQNAAMGPGQQAADLARSGGDPAQAGPGLMGPDGQPLPDPDTTAPVAAEGPAARMADADFGLGGSNVPETTGPPPAAGTHPAPGVWDLAFFTQGATSNEPGEDQMTDEEQEPIVEAVADRMADTDFGLGGASPELDDTDETPPAGDKPEPGTWDPSFFTR